MAAPNHYHPNRPRYIPVYKERCAARGLLFMLDPERGLIEIEVKGVIHIVDLSVEIREWEARQQEQEPTQNEVLTNSI